MHIFNAAQDRGTAPCCVSEKQKQKRFFLRVTPFEKAAPFGDLRVLLVDQG
jgi:hypothetical protein